MYVIFDCTQSFGFYRRTRSRTLARFFAWFATWRTGRFHDWDTYGRYLRNEG